MSPAKGPMSTEQHSHSSMPITPQPRLSRSSRSQRSLHFSWTPLVSVSASFMVVFVVSSLLIVSPSFSGVSVDAYPVIMSPNELLRKHNVMAIEIDNPEEVLSVLDNLIQSILVSIDYHQQHGTSPYQNQNNQNSMNSMAANNQNNNNNLMQNQNNIEKSLGSKRGIDLGLSRGFSGNQAAKHLMGMSAASFANGPGRRR